MTPVTIDTIGKMMEHGYVAQGWCLVEKRGFPIDLEKLAEKVGWDWIFIGQKWPVTCPYCGGSDVEVRIAADDSLWRE